MLRGRHDEGIPYQVRAAAAGMRAAAAGAAASRRPSRYMTGVSTSARAIIISAATHADEPVT